MTTLSLDIPDVMLLHANGSLMELKKETQLEGSVAPFLQEMKSKNYRLSDKLIEMVLKDVGETG